MNILEGETLYYVNRYFEQDAKEMGFYSEELMEYLSDGGSLKDRTEVPDEIKEIIKETVASAKTKDVEQVGLKLIKFCAKWDLQRIAEYPQSYAEPLNAKYKKEEVK